MDHTEFETFIASPQPENLPDGHPNHWHVSFKPTPGRPAFSTLLIVNPWSKVIHSCATYDLAQLMSSYTLERVAEAWIIVLLKKFADECRFRPRAWTVDTVFLAQTINNALDLIGSAPHMPVAYVADGPEVERVYDIWRTHCNMMSRELVGPSPRDARTQFIYVYWPLTQPANNMPPPPAPHPPPPPPPPAEVAAAPASPGDSPFQPANNQSPPPSFVLDPALLFLDDDLYSGFV